MKNICRTIFLLIYNSTFIIYNSFSQTAPGIEWQNTIGGDSTDELYCITQTTDGGYICGGYSESNISGDKNENSIGSWDFWIVKLDSSGSIQWQNTIGGDSIDWLKIIEQTVDGGYICGGSSRSNISGDKTENCWGDWDFWIIKLDSTGNIQWQNTIGGNAYDNLAVVFQTSDGGYFCVGYSYSNVSGDKTENSMGFGDYWVVKLDSAGNIQWQNTIGGSNYDWPYSAELTNDGGFILGVHLPQTFQAIKPKILKVLAIIG